MQKKNFFELLRNFLAMWAGAIVLIFILLQVKEMAEAFVLNAPNAFKVVTDWQIVLTTMGVSLVITAIIGVFKKLRKE